MSRIARNIMMALTLAVLAGGVGCADDKNKMSDQDQAAQAAADRIQALEDQLAQAEHDRVADRERMLALQNELDACRDQLASQKSPAEGWSAIGDGAWTSIEGTVLFDSGKAELISTGEATLAAVAHVIKEQFPNHEIYVFGHTDNDPINASGWVDNYELSCQRALTVVRALKSMGLTADLAACGWGETRPIMPNETSEGMQANRRVEIYAIKPR